MVAINSISNSNPAVIQEQEKTEADNAFKLAWITAIAVATIAAAVWNYMEERPWIAAAVCLGGICLEIALFLLLPSQVEDDEEIEEAIPPTAPPIVFNKLSDELAFIIKKLETVCPVENIIAISQQTGGIMGQACGDAIGLFTEFTTKSEAQAMIAGNPIDFSPAYPEKFQNGHNWAHIKRFVKNGWTDDTDQAFSLLRAISLAMNPPNERAPSFDILFANELMKWRRHGLRAEGQFLGRAEPYCMGLGALVSSVLNEPSFLTNPKQAAENIWAKDRTIPLQNRPAANGAIMRTSPIGLIFYHSLNDVVSYTTEACKVTHADPRCIASCVAFNVAIALSLRGYAREVIFIAAEEVGLATLAHELNFVAEKQLLSLQETANLDTLHQALADDFKAHLNGDWESLDLDEGYKDKDKPVNKIGYTFKCMGAAFYALQLSGQVLQDENDSSSDRFRTIIEMIAAEGGDADTNGAAAGALLGAYLGGDCIPTNWRTGLADASVLFQARNLIFNCSLEHAKNLNLKPES